MGDQARKAGESFRGVIGDALPQAKRHGIGAVVPGGVAAVDLFRAALPTATSFMQGLLGQRGPAASPAAQAVARAPARNVPTNPLAAEAYARGAARAARGSAGKAPTFADLASAFAASNGGNISLNQLGALSDIAYKTSPRETVRQPTFKDIVGQEWLNRQQEMLMKEQAHADELSKRDPVAGEAYGKAAVEKYIQALPQAFGVDPLEQIQAEYLNNQQGQ